VQIPAELFKPAGYVHQEALFGIPHYGGSIAQRLLYGGNTSVPFTLCSDADAAAFVNPNPNQPFVLLIDRGGTDCTFVSKVRRAQKIGAAGALIVDDRCLCADVACSSTVACEAVEPIMADDGSGADITIPSFLMKKPDGDTIKTHLQAQRFIQVRTVFTYTDSFSRMLACSIAYSNRSAAFNNRSTEQASSCCAIALDSTSAADLTLMRFVHISASFLAVCCSAHCVWWYDMRSLLALTKLSTLLLPHRLR
jgi:PA domain